jgi:hypothetical protein
MTGRLFGPLLHERFVLAPAHVMARGGMILSGGHGFPRGAPVRLSITLARVPPSRFEDHSTRTLDRGRHRMIKTVVPRQGIDPHDPMEPILHTKGPNGVSIPLPHAHRYSMHPRLRLVRDSACPSYAFPKGHATRVRASLHDEALQFGPPHGARLVLNWIANHPQCQTLNFGELTRHYSSSKTYDREMLMEGACWLEKRYALRAIAVDESAPRLAGRPRAREWAIHPELPGRRIPDSR